MEDKGEGKLNSGDLFIQIQLSFSLLKMVTMVKVIAFGLIRSGIAHSIAKLLHSWNTGMVINSPLLYLPIVQMLPDG